MRRAIRAISAVVTLAFLLVTPAHPAPVHSPPPVSANLVSYTIPAAHAVHHQAAPKTYTVQPGDTLSLIAGRLGVPGGWQALWQANRAVIADPNVIYAGQVLDLPGSGATADTDAITPPPHNAGGFPHTGIYTFSMLEAVWIWAGGPSDVAWDMATIAECESGGKTWAYNPSGASGLWQILGTPFAGDPMDGPTNAQMAVAKYEAPQYTGGPIMGTRPWVCQA